MTTNRISPDELSALLGQNKSDDTSHSLSNVELEALSELVHVSFMSSTKTLSTFFSKSVVVTPPTLQIKEKSELFATTEAPLFIALGEFFWSIQGSHFLSISHSDVDKLSELVEQADDETEQDETHFSFVQSVIEKLFSTITESMTTVFNQHVSHTLNGIDRIETHPEFPVNKFTSEDYFLEIQLAFNVEQQSVRIFDYIPISIAKKIVGLLTDTIGEQSEEGVEEMPIQSNELFNEKDELKNSKLNKDPRIQSVQFSSFDEPSPSSVEPNNLNMLLDIPLQVTVELGRTKRKVKEILEISQGSIIELDKLAGEPVDILINDKLIAVGEVVVIDENFGVRVTDILSTEERLSKLR